MPQQAHEIAHFAFRPFPVFRGKSIKRQHFQPHLPRRSRSPPDGLDACLMSGETRQQPFLRPTPVAIHDRSEEHTSELQSLMRISYAVFCLTKKKKTTRNETLSQH